MRKIAFVSVLLALGGCAKGVNSIPPAVVPTIGYESMACAKLGEERIQNLQALNALSVAQENAASNDAMGVLFLGLPIGSMTGQDKEAAVSVAKGRDLSISAVMAAKNCPGANS